ncbi:hypothetical protein C4564_03510 [Candidatus Microgenomates bacterium]|nr:MAG: hypothetical protein C4564_03510 [Candidatus Microgenomates bacterium]
MSKTKRLVYVLCILGLLTPQIAFAEDWMQEAHDAARTGFTSETPAEPWQFLWQFNASDSNGAVSCPNNDPTKGHCYNAPKEARTITGGDFVFVPAGSWGMYALRKSNGSVAWRLQNAAFNATPAYENGYVYAGGTNGTLYKINASTGSVAATYNAGSGINKAILLAQGAVFVVSDNSKLHKVNASNMQASWVYTPAGNPQPGTPPSFSASRGLIVYATNDLYVHAIQTANGNPLWRVKPSPNTAGFPYEFDGYWPVVAESHGIVFLRMRLEHNALYGPGDKNMYFATNAENRNYLQSNPNKKNLFALDLTNGSDKFIPAVGYGGVEDYVNNSPYLDMGPVPVVKTTSDGKEVAYQVFRSNQANPPDGRWDSQMGEMVLDGNTIPGLAAGDLRYVAMASLGKNGLNSQTFITDEQTPYTVAGNTIFNAHWGASEAVTIIDRSPGLGLNWTNPIKTRVHNAVIRRLTACGTKNLSTHFANCNMSLFNDGRYWGSSGWWVYWNVIDPPGTVSSSAYSAGILPRYTYVADGLIVVEGNGGDLFVLKHSGSGGTSTATPISTPAPIPGDTNSDGKVDGVDYVIWLNNYGSSVSNGEKSGDFDKSGKVDGVDYVIWLQNYN